MFLHELEDNANTILANCCFLNGMLVIVCMSNRNIRYLHLLGAFDAIMTHGNIGDAAEALHVTQSAVSKQLSQLRAWLEDDLFVRTRHGMQPTPRALALQNPVQAILEHASRLTPDPEVVPAEFTGRFVLSATDEMLARLTPALLDQFQKHSPTMQLVTLPLVKDYLVRQLEAGLVNLVVAVNWNAPESLIQKRLGSDKFVCVMHKGHPLAAQNMTLKRYANATHVLVAPFGTEKGVVDFELQHLGLERHVCASVSAFSMINEKILGETRIATLPSRVAQGLVESGPLISKPVPLRLPLSHYFGIWHARFAAEPRLRWVLGCIDKIFTSS